MNPYDPVTQPKEWAQWQSEHSGAPKTETKTETKPGETPKSTALPGTGSTPPGQTGTLSAFPEGTKFPAGATTRGIAPNGLWYEKMSDGTVKEGYPASQADRLAVGAGPVSQKPGTVTAQQVQTNATARTPTTTPTPPPATPLPAPGQPGAFGPAFQNDQQAAANAGLRGAIAQSASGNVGPAIANAGGLPGTLTEKQGTTIPGMGAYNLPGFGVPSEGRQTLFDNNGLNTLYANNPNGPQIQFGPGQRNGREGNSIGFGGSQARQGPGGNETRIAPQTLFPGVEASVPDTYVKGAGNINDANRAFDVPFNIGPGGVSLANIGGSNVQLNSADRSQGMGFALTPQTPSEKFAATSFGASTGRQLSADPALQAMQTLQLIAAMNQGNSIGQLTEANRAQYSGNPAQGQGTYFAGAAPGPQATAVAPVAAAPPVAAPASGVPNDDNNDGIADYAKGGTLNLLPRRTGKTARPLGLASGGSIIAPVTPGGTGVGADAINTTAGGTSYQPSVALAGSGNLTSTSSRGATVNGNINPYGTPNATPTGTESSFLSLTPEDQAKFAPFQQFAQQAASLQHARDNTDYIRGRAGLAKATEVPYFGGQSQDEGMAPGQFTGYGSWINSLINNVGNKAQQLTEMGNPGSPEEVNSQINSITQQIAPYQNAQDLITKIQGYGEVGNEEQLIGEINAIRTQAGPLAGIGDAQAKLQALGQPADLTQYYGQINSLQNTIDQGYEYQKTIDALSAAYEKAKGTSQEDDAQRALSSSLAFAGQFIQAGETAKGQMLETKNQLGVAQSRNNTIQQQTEAYQNLLAASGLTEAQIAPALAAYQTQITAKEQALKNAQTVGQLNLQLQNMSLGQNPQQIASTLAGFQSQLSPLQQSLANVNKAAEIRGQLGNVLNTPLPKLPGFKKGGSIKVKNSMVTPERIIGVGATSGKPYFQVGEPRYPGGRDAPERLDFPSANKMKVTPLPMRATKPQLVAEQPKKEKPRPRRMPIGKQAVKKAFSDGGSVVVPAKESTSDSPAKAESSKRTLRLPSGRKITIEEAS